MLWFSKWYQSVSVRAPLACVSLFCLALLACDAGQTASPSTQPNTPAPSLRAPHTANTATQKTWCEQVSTRLKSVPVARCTATPLLDAGALSVQQRPIFYAQIPAPKTDAQTPRILLMGGIHGDELTATALMFDWLPFLKEPASQPYSWVLVPLLNPDGLMASPPTRVNANGVDLNRNFPTPNWEKEAKPYWEKRTGKDPRRFPGNAPLSEPESRWLHALVESYQPDVIVSVHAPYGVLDFDGPANPPQKLGRLMYRQVGVYPGSLGNYNGVHKGVPVITIELPHALNKPSPEETRKIWEDLLRWLSEQARHHNLKPQMKSPNLAKTAP